MTGQQLRSDALMALMTSTGIQQYGNITTKQTMFVKTASDFRMLQFFFLQSQHFMIISEEYSE